MVQSIKDHWNIFNQINSRRSQTSILCIKFPVFFRWRAVHENACKSLHESTENCWSSLSIQNVNHLQVYFCGIRPSLISLTEGRGATFVTPVRVHRKYFISMYFLRKVISQFQPKKKISCFWGKNIIFPDNTRKIMSSRGSFSKDHLFRKLEENVIFPCIFLRKIIFHFPPKV